MKKAAAILFAMISFYGLNAQKESAIWYFGDRAGLDFNTGFPVALEDGELSTVEGCAAISTPEGVLRFYTDGITVRNRDHEIMPNGTGLKGHSSSTQSAIIVPAGKNTGIYYIFSTDFQTRGGLYYSKVAMDRDNGYGDVVSKNILLDRTVTEKLTAVKHKNGEDVWVIAHDWGNNEYLVYLVTTEGVVEAPVVSKLGFSLDYAMEGSDVLKSRGYLKASVDGTRLGACHSFVGVELLDFNTATGVVSNARTLMEAGDKDFYGLEFSPYGDVLYVSVINDDIYQFDMAQRYPELSIVSLGIPKKNAGALQLALNGAIYVASQGILSVIENPEKLGQECSFRSNILDLGQGSSTYGLPPFVTSFFELGIKATGFCFGDTTSFSFASTEPIDSILWDFGDGNSSTAHSPSSSYVMPGEYTVSATVQIGTIIKVETRKIRIYESPRAFDVAFFRCEENGILETPVDLSSLDAAVLKQQKDLYFEVFYFSDLEDAHSNENRLEKNHNSISNVETLYARVQHIDSKSCYAISQVVLKIIEKPKPDLKEEYRICPFDPDLMLDGGDFDSWTWQNEQGMVIGETRYLDVKALGDYSLTVEKEVAGIRCDNTLLFTTVPLDLPKDFTTIISHFTDDITINIAAMGAGEFEYSIDGENYRAENRFNVLPGKYTVYVKDVGGCRIISKEVIALGYQKFFTPNGDNINDRWSITGSEHVPFFTVAIFDRYGKLLKKIGPDDVGWDGTYQSVQMPSADYWFKFENEEGLVFKSHFSLKR